MATPHFISKIQFTRNTRIRSHRVTEEAEKSQREYWKCVSHEVTEKGQRTARENTYFERLPRRYSPRDAANPPGPAGRPSLVTLIHTLTRLRFSCSNLFSLCSPLLLSYSVLRSLSPVLFYLQVVQRIDRRTVLAHFKMKMRPCRVTGRAYTRDQFAFTHHLSLTDKKRRIMRI